MNSRRPWHWPLSPMVQIPLLNPVDQHQPNHRKKRKNRLKRHEETGENEQISDVNILISNLELNLLVDLIDLILMRIHLIVRHQFPLGIEEEEYERRVDKFSQRVDQRSSYPQNEHILNQPILVVNVVLDEVVGNNRNENGVDQLRQY